MRAIALALLLAACGRAPEQATALDQLDNELAAADGANTTDPAIAAALRDPLMVDPDLQQEANANAVKPPPQPDPGAVPLDTPLPGSAVATRPAAPPGATCPDCAAKTGAYTLGALAARQRGGRTAGCAALTYSAGWANRLPADLPLYPDARVQEAAGTDAGCAVRVVSFGSAAAPQKLVDWYYARAKAAGYSAEPQRQADLRVVGGTRGSSAYVMYASARADGGSDVDLLVNTGR